MRGSGCRNRKHRDLGLTPPQTGLWADNFGHGDIDEKKEAELIRSLREFG